MPDILNEDGLQIKSANELVSELESGFKDVYGDDINVEQNSPDGQIINITAQAGIDVRELIQEVYNSFDPDTASGVVLDQRVAINGIERQAGTFTLVDVDVTTDRGLTLSGLDADANDPDGTGYTVADDAGNEFILVTTEVIVSAGTKTLRFRAKNIGQVETTTNTITNPVTIVLGVTGLNNPSGAIQTGQDEETDAQLRARRVRSVANASSGYLNGLLGTVLNLEGVTDAKLYENITSAVDGDGIPAHGIWLIARGGSDADIGNAIYEKKSAGCDMKGDEEFSITTESGVDFTAKFDRPTSSDLYIEFNIQPTSGSTFDEASIKQGIVDELTFGIGDAADETSVSIVAQNVLTSLGNGGKVIGTKISDDDATYVDYLVTPTKQAQWVLDVSRISITVL